MNFLLLSADEKVRVRNKIIAGSTSLEDDPLTCWTYIASSFSDGYARIWLFEKSRRVHKVAYELDNGPVEEGRILCHTCNNRRCWRPSHIYLGTYTTNNNDTFQHGNGRLGERHQNAVLTDIKVKQIRDLYKAGNSQQQIGAIVGCSRQAVGTVLRGETWKHV